MKIWINTTENLNTQNSKPPFDKNYITSLLRSHDAIAEIEFTDSWFDTTWEPRTHERVFGRIRYCDKEGVWEYVEYPSWDDKYTYEREHEETDSLEALLDIVDRHYNSLNRPHPYVKAIILSGERYRDVQYKETSNSKLASGETTSKSTINNSNLGKPDKDVISFWATTVFDTEHKAIAYGANIKTTDGWEFPRDVNSIQQKLGEKRFKQFSKGEIKLFKSYSTLIRFLNGMNPYMSIADEQAIIDAGYNNKYFVH